MKRRNMNKIQSTQRRKVRPTHPREILREDVLPGLGLTQGEFAERLGVYLAERHDGPSSLV
jgi:hypothetical protein